MSEHCPVCGFGELPFHPSDHNICPCCGTEFGYHDRRLSHAQLRGMWVARGANWFSKAFPQPAGWSAIAQLQRAQLVRPILPLKAKAANQSAALSHGDEFRVKAIA
jgi:hypothetical protein